MVENSLSNLKQELEKAEVAGMTRLVQAAAFKDDDTGVHIIRVAFLSLEMARLVGVPENQCLPLFYASALHDLGKVGISDQILQKPGSLTEEEKAVMQRHSVLGSYFFQSFNSDISKVCYDVILNHHENYDGSGYPNGLRGDDIPFFARIVSIVDVFDALVMKRCYRDAYSYDEALSMISGSMESKFDPELLNVFINNIERLKELHQLISELGNVKDLFEFYG
ncbi:HD-GYP domain-containing protein [Neptuniibacter sp. SY11_33]|uniref:HD-GYP domain-containing protein n=1 Tax=Neptuniibacter sp. SY11_33 TaxID=3398215 RepID=UPI0039F5515D